MSPTLAELRAQGCVCGTGPYPCPVHSDPGDGRGERAWIQDGGLLRNWPLLNTCCGRCTFAADRCRREIDAITARAADAQRALTPEEEESVAIFTAAIPILRQADGVLYPNPYELLSGADPRTGLPVNKGGRTFRYDEEDQRQRARPTGICPRCSTPAAEAKLRQECIDAGYGILPVGVFVRTPSNQAAAT